MVRTSTVQRRPRRLPRQRPRQPRRRPPLRRRSDCRHAGNACHPRDAGQEELVGTGRRQERQPEPDRSESVNSLSKVFVEADADADGQLTPDEYKAYLAANGKGSPSRRPGLINHDDTADPASAVFFVTRVCASTRKRTRRTFPEEPLMKSSFRIASLTLFALSALLLSACASTTEAGVSADASDTEVNASASGSTTTTYDKHHRGTVGGQRRPVIGSGRA